MSFEKDMEAFFQKKTGNNARGTLSQLLLFA